MFPRDIGRRVRLPDEIEQDFGFRFLQTQPPGKPTQISRYHQTPHPGQRVCSVDPFQERILRYRMPPEGSSPCRTRPRFGPLPPAG